MYRVWFCDLEKAIAAFRKVVKDDLFCKIEGNAYGDFVFTLNEKGTYIVKHTDFSVWHSVGDWRHGYWKKVEVSPITENLDEVIDEIFCSYKSPFISSWAPGEPLPSLEEEEEECFEPGRPVNDIMALNP